MPFFRLDFLREVRFVAGELKSLTCPKNSLIRSKFLHRHINWFSEVKYSEEYISSVFSIEDSIFFFFNAPLVEYTLTLND